MFRTADGIVTPHSTTWQSEGHTGSRQPYVWYISASLRQCLRRGFPRSRCGGIGKEQARRRVRAWGISSVPVGDERTRHKRSETTIRAASASGSSSVGYVYGLPRLHRVTFTFRPQWRGRAMDPSTLILGTPLGGLGRRAEESREARGAVRRGETPRERARWSKKSPSTSNMRTISEETTRVRAQSDFRGGLCRWSPVCSRTATCLQRDTPCVEWSGAVGGPGGAGRTEV